jgi:thiazole synthase/sulfur carrier protein
MTLTVNNKTVDYVEDETIQDLLTRLKFTFPLVIVKINGKHVSRDRYSEVLIPDNADIQVIHMISGG